MSKFSILYDEWESDDNKYDIVHMRDQAFSKQALNEFGSLPKKQP